MGSCSHFNTAFLQILLNKRIWNFFMWSLQIPACVLWAMSLGLEGLKRPYRFPTSSCTLLIPCCKPESSVCLKVCMRCCLCLSADVRVAARHRLWMIHAALNQCTLGSLLPLEVKYNPSRSHVYSSYERMLTCDLKGSAHLWIHWQSTSPLAFSLPCCWVLMLDRDLPFLARLLHHSWVVDMTRHGWTLRLIYSYVGLWEFCKTFVISLKMRCLSCHKGQSKEEIASLPM